MKRSIFTNPAKWVKGLLLSLFLLNLSAPLQAQEKLEAGGGVEFVSKYLWRGQNYANASVQPSGWLSYHGFSLEVFGSFGFTKDDVAEFDLILSYENGGFFANITDCWTAFYGDGTKYFEYGANSTSHIFEATVGYDFGPLSLAWSTNFAGYDGITKKGRRAYSSYLEMNVPFTLLTIDWQGTVGLTPWNTDYYYNATSFAVCDISLQAAKEIKFSENFGISLFVKYCVNPSTMQTYFLGGISL